MVGLEFRRQSISVTDWICILTLIILIVGSVVGPYLLHYTPDDVDFTHIAEPPGSLHWLGTDELGRDVLSRLLYGARTSLVIAVSVQLAATFFGSLVGLIAGYSRRVVDATLMSIVDAFYAFPGLVFVVVMIAVLPHGLVAIIVSLTFVSWPLPARLMRAKVLALRNEEFVLAARALGATDTRVLIRHVLPNAMGPIIVQFVQGSAAAVMGEAALSYMGIGLPSSYPTWGIMIAKGRDYLQSSPHLALFPIVALTAMVLSLYWLGNTLRNRFDPFSKRF